MENPLSNFAPKSNRDNQLKKGAVRRVYKKRKKKPKHSSRLISMVATAVLLSSTGLIVIFAWVSVQLIFNPYQMGWINKFLPEWVKISLDGKEHPFVKATDENQGSVPSPFSWNS